MSTRTSAEDFDRLHVRRLDAEGCPALRDDLLTFVDQHHALAGDTTPANESAPPPISLDEACAKLTAVYPALAEALKHCCIQRLSSRAAAPLLGLDHVTVWRRTNQALDLIASWCGLPSRKHVENRFLLMKQKGKI